MQLRVVAVGKVRERYVASACEDFGKRIRPYYPIEILEVKASAASHQAAALREEAGRILNVLHDEDCVWLLDRSGDELSSEELGRMFAGISNAGARRLVFIVAGTFGADDSLRDRADFIWSLSKLTFLHEWARMIVLEQIYRSAKITRNEPYHH